jgi:hypothetical protein
MRARHAYQHVYNRRDYTPYTDNRFEMEIYRLAGRGRSKQHVPTLPTLASERIEMVGVVPTRLRRPGLQPWVVLPRAEALVRHAEA